ncbi:MAG: class I SAM-dependent methyltransferase [Bacteroidetes bacterium]|nr:class I SAM-dependent methyltransferase [Bacteroidota bacterium]
MQRDLKKINQEYEQSEIDPWGSDWRGSLALWHKFCTEKVISNLKTNLEHTQKLKIADIGCGSGILTEKLYKAISNEFNISQYDAVDVSVAAIEKAKKIFTHTEVIYSIISEDLHELENKKFDLIFGFQFLSYLSRIERKNLFLTVKSLLGPNGIAVFSSNVRSEGDDFAYINSSDLEIDMKQDFILIDKADLFTAQYVEKFEGKIFKYSKFYPIRSILSSSYFPTKFHNYYSKHSTDSYPTKRMRMYFLK